jgi:putative Holliday junction resolvase
VGYRESVLHTEDPVRDLAMLGRRCVRPGVRLALDVGAARIGVARCDPGAMLASPLTTVRRGRGDLDHVAALAATAQPVEVVVGLPTGLSGREGPAAARARDFAHALAARLAPVPVRLVDERFTTVLAHSALREAGHATRRHREVVDKSAAAVILQGALDAERATGQPVGEVIGPAPGTSG